MATSRKRQPARNPAELIVDRIKNRMAEAGDSVPRIPGHHRRLLEAWLSAFPEGWYSIPKPSGNNVADYVRSEMLVNGITDFLVAERGLLVCVSIVKVVWPSGSFIGKLDWCGMSFDEALKRAATAWKLWPVDVEADAIRVFRDHYLVRRNTNVDSVQNTTIEKLNAGEFMCHPPDFIRFTECDRANEEAAIRRAVENNPPFVGENKTAVVEAEAAVEAAAQLLGTPESVPASFQSLLDWGKQQRVHPMQQVLQNALLNALGQPDTGLAPLPGPEWGANRTDKLDRYFEVWDYVSKPGNEKKTPYAIQQAIGVNDEMVKRILEETRRPTAEEIKQRRIEKKQRKR
jgi:hypothetical protein